CLRSARHVARRRGMGHESRCSRLPGDGVGDGLRHRRVPRLPAAAQPGGSGGVFQRGAVAVRQSRVRHVLYRGPGVRGARPRLGARGMSDLGKRIDLSVRIGTLELANPVLVASGTFGYGDEYAHVVDPRRLGAVITKTVTLEPRAGNPPQRVAESAGGMLNSIGLEN